MDIMGITVLALGWNEALLEAEALVAKPGPGEELAFLDGQTVLRQLVDRKCRARLRDQVLFPAGRLLGLAARLARRQLPAVFSGAAFVPALLTFMERPSNVLVIGTDGATVRLLGGRLQNHAPWHRVCAIGVEEWQAGQEADLVIFAKRQASARERMQLASMRCGLVVFAGSMLAGITRDEAFAQPVRDTVAKVRKAA